MYEKHFSIYLYTIKLYFKCTYWKASKPITLTVKEKQQITLVVKKYFKKTFCSFNPNRYKYDVSPILGNTQDNKFLLNEEICKI